jgi:hypothetical protein
VTRRSATAEAEPYFRVSKASRISGISLMEDGYIGLIPSGSPVSHSRSFDPLSPRNIGNRL